MLKQMRTAAHLISSLFTRNQHTCTSFGKL